MKRLLFLIVFVSFVFGASAQLKVDSIGSSFFGEQPEETFDKLVDATVTAYGKGASVLNLYNDHSVIAYWDRGAPYFIQCVFGNTNEEQEGGVGTIGKREFHRVFYVNSNGTVFANGGTIQPAVDPSNSSLAYSKETKEFSALDKLISINGVSYIENQDMQQPKSTLSGDVVQKKKRLGLFAEEVEATVPEAVITLSDSIKCISYSDLVVVLIDAVNELNAEVVSLKEKLSLANDNTMKKEQAIASTDEMEYRETYVSQNTPNPFDSETVISYGLADSVNEAYIYLYDLQGKQVKSYKLKNRNGEVVIGASELVAGMYIYSLIADGREVESYRMILTE